MESEKNMKGEKLQVGQVGGSGETETPQQVDIFEVYDELKGLKSNYDSVIGMLDLAEKNDDSP